MNKVKNASPGFMLYYDYAQAFGLLHGGILSFFQDKLSILDETYVDEDDFISFNLEAIQELLIVTVDDIREALTVGKSMGIIIDFAFMGTRVFIRSRYEKIICNGEGDRYNV